MNPNPEQDPRTSPASAPADLLRRDAQACRWDVVSLGEVMLRFDPGDRRITSARSFDVWEGGGEYNVARGLRRCFGMRTAVVTALVDNMVGRLIEDLMLQGGVDTRHVQWRTFDGVGRHARNGLYFLERGFGVRSAVGMMDRGHTAIAQMKPGDVNWDELFATEGVRWFHTGGIMAGLSDRSSEVVREAMQAAQRHGVVVSFDGNYRASLWHDRGGRAASVEVNRSLMPFVDVLFGHEGDLAESLGESSHRPAWHTSESFAEMASRVVAEFPNIRVLATSIRQPHSASRNHWGAFAFSQSRMYRGISFPDLEVLDRVGGGDAFAAGIIYGLLSARGVQWALDCGVAHGALAMTTPGDASAATLMDIDRVMRGELAQTAR